MAKTSWSEHEKQIISCQKCRRLRDHCELVAQKKKREFLSWDYWGKPVPGFGDKNAEVWLVGLAPAAHGANRTGRMFTGDSSGDWLYRALNEFGFANSKESKSARDGMVLKNIYISAAARCAPPDNKPTRDELKNCAPYLVAELSLLKNLKMIVCLGSIAFESTLALFPPLKPKPKFGHGKQYTVGNLKLLCSYHPSRQNTNTGRLTKPMWDSIFAQIKKSYPA